MKALQKKMIYCAVVSTAGALLFILNLTKNGETSSLLSGIGVGLFAVGLLKLMRFYKLSKNKEKAEAYDLAQHDERIIYIGYRSAALVWYAYLVIAYIAIIVFGLMNQIVITGIICYVVGAQVLLYLGIYYYLNKKY